MSVIVRCHHVGQLSFQAWFLAVLIGTATSRPTGPDNAVIEVSPSQWGLLLRLGESKIEPSQVFSLKPHPKVLFIKMHQKSVPLILFRRVSVGAGERGAVEGAAGRLPVPHVHRRHQSLQEDRFVKFEPLPQRLNLFRHICSFENSLVNVFPFLRPFHRLKLSFLGPTLSVPFL